MSDGAHASYRSALVTRNDTSELARIAEWVEKVCTTAGFPHRTSLALQLCVEEAVSNIVTHGQGSARAREIVLSVARKGADVVLTVDDDGEPFDPTAVCPPRPPDTLEDAPVGGFGIHLMRQFSSSIEYRRTCGRNRLHLTFVEALSTLERRGR
jgi:serine/threonine-protein kinase RsbW